MTRFAITLMSLMAGLAVAVSPVALGEARAQELQVKRSSVAGLKVGDKLPESGKLKVPSGAEVELFKPSEGRSYTVKGPYEGTLAEYTNPCPWWKAATGSCKKEELDTGGTRGVSEVPGAVRGFRKPPAEQPPQQ